MRRPTSADVRNAHIRGRRQRGRSRTPRFPPLPPARRRPIDSIAGLREIERVFRRVVVFTYDNTDRTWRCWFWMTRDYLPRSLPSMSVSLPSLPRHGLELVPSTAPVSSSAGRCSGHTDRDSIVVATSVERGRPLHRISQLARRPLPARLAGVAARGWSARKVKDGKQPEFLAQDLPMATRVLDEGALAGGLRLRSS